MNLPRLSKSVRRVTILQNDGGTITPVTVYQRKQGKKKKQSRAFQPIERLVRRVADATEATADRYVARHRTSNRKRRDGWIRDLNLNLARAGQKGVRRLRVTRLLMP